MQHSNLHTIKFISILTIFVSLLLSITSTQLKNMQIQNVEIDMKKNILKSIGLKLDKASSEEIINQYNKYIDEIVFASNGKKVEILISQLNIKEDKSTGERIYSYENKRYFPAYISNQLNAFIIPISGKGLWSTLYGYFAISKTDYNTVKGITFYKHGETPGLGAEVDKEWFQDQFKEINNKKIFNDIGKLVSIKVAKGVAKNLSHEVDGISGATITSQGLTSFLYRDLNNYIPYLKLHAFYE